MRAVMLGTLFALALLLAPAAARASPLPCTQISDEGAPVTLAALLAAGDAALRAALEALEPQDDLLAARACYERALQQSPDSYAASLGLGVGEVLRAQHLGRSRQDAADAIGQAKLHLGRAYFLRQDPYEPLYYLAEVALLEGDLAQAEALLQPLQEARWKEGAVYLLLAELAERGARPQVRGCERAKDLSRCCHERALDAGGAPRIYRYAAHRLGRHREGPWSIAQKQGVSAELNGLHAGSWFVAGIELGRTLNQSRNLSVVLPLQLHVLGADPGGFSDDDKKTRYRLLLMVGLQYDLVWPLRGFTFYGRLSTGLSLEWNTRRSAVAIDKPYEGDDKMLYRGDPIWVVLPELGVRYSPLGRFHFGADLLSLPLALRKDRLQVNYQALLYAGAHF